MSEFKAQILGIIIVLTLFTVVSSAASEFFDSTWTKIEQVQSNEISKATS